MNEEEKEIAYKNGMSFGEEQQLYWKEYKDKVFSVSGGRRTGKTWEEYVRQANINIELQQRIDKAIEIYKKRNTCEYKKKRFMEDKSTSYLMYEILKGEDKE